MSNSLNMAKTALVYFVAAATIVATAGLTALVPQQASAAQYGDLITSESLQTVYYYGSDGQRYAFPNEKTYFTWYSDFDNVVEMTDEEVADIPLAGNIMYRPGSRWVKITSDEKTYAVSPDGSLHWVETEEVAEDLAGSDWNTFIDDVPDVFFVDYTVGASIDDASQGHEGMLVEDGADTYLLWEGEKREVTAAGFSANGFQDRSVLPGAGVDLTSIPTGDVISSEKAYLTDSAQMVATDDFQETEDVTVSMAASSPGASTYLAEQSIADLAAYSFTNTTSEEAVVTDFAVERFGVSADTTLSDVYLFDGLVRLSNNASVSEGVASWSDAGGLFTVPANGTFTVRVRSDIKAGTSGETVGVRLASSADVEFASSFQAMGGFPLTGAEHTIASKPSSTFGSVAFSSTIQPTAGTVEAQDDFRVWQDSSAQLSNNDADLHVFRLRNIGSVDASDVENWRLYVGGIERAQVDAEDEDGYVTFDMTANPVEVTAGSHDVKVLVDLIGGASRTIQADLRKGADAIFIDEDYNQPIPVTLPATDAGEQTIDSGSLSFTKTADSPAGDVVDNASNVALARWEAKAAGEPMRVETLRANFTGETSYSAATIAFVDSNPDTITDSGNGFVTAGFEAGESITVTNATTGANNDTFTIASVAAGTITLVAGDALTAEAADATAVTITTDDIGSLRNGAFYADGTQIGSTTTLNEDSASTAYTEYDFGSSLTVYPGSPVELELRADIYDNDGTNDIVSNSTIQARLYGTQASNNVEQLTSGGYVTRPAAASPVAANQITVTDAGLTVAENTNYADPTVTVPKTAFKVGSWTVGATTVEDITLTSLDVDFAKAGSAADASDDLTDLYLEYGPEGGAMVTTTIKTSVADSDNNWSVNFDLTAGETIVVNAYADAETSITDGGTDDTLTATLDVTATAPSSGSSPSDSSAAQTVTYVQNGSFTTALDGESPNARLVAGNQEVHAGSYRFTAIDETYTIKEVKVSVASGAAGVVSEARLYDGSDLLDTAVFSLNSNTEALFEGFTVPVEKNSYKTLQVKFALNQIGTSQGTSHTDAKVTLATVKYADSQGVETTVTETDAANELLVYKSVPTVEHVDLTNSAIINGGARDLYKFTVTADANGAVALKQLTFDLSWNDADGDDGLTKTLELESLKFYKDGANITDDVNIMSDSAADVEDGSGVTRADNGVGAVTEDSSILVVWDTGNEVASGNTGGEELIPAGSTATFTLRGTPQGFATDNDAVSLYLQGDTTDVEDHVTLGLHTYLNHGASTDEILVLHDAAEAAEAGDAANFIWSDNSAAGHSAVPNGSSSGDWTNGYNVLSLDLDQEQWVY